MVPRGRPIIAIDYKYNTQKFLSFIVTENEGITQAGFTYLSKYPEHFSNVSIHPVTFLLSCISSLDLLMMLTPTTNQGSLIWL